MRVRFFDTLYNRESVYIVAPGTDIEFKDGRAHFAWCGSRVAIELEYIIAIEYLDSER